MKRRINNRICRFLCRARFWFIALTVLMLPFYGTSAVAAPTVSEAKIDRPNVVIIMVDDAGLMDFEPFGGEAHMPNIQELAEQGTRFTQYRSSPLCAPSRAMLLTGIDNHRTGIASIPEVLLDEHQGAAGYSMFLEPGVKTIADRLRDNGYRTYMTGKWHMGSRVEDLPVSHGFDRSFVLDASGADNWEQRSYMPYYDTAPWFEDDRPAKLPEEFYSSEFIVDKMIDYIDQGNAHPGQAKQPFLAYLAFQAIHIPIQAPREFIDHYEGVYDQGWHVLRQQRWQKAQMLGLIPANAPLADMPAGLRDWQALSAQERRYYSKAMAVNAAMLEAMDYHIGRLLDWLDSQGELDNTVFVVTSDNGPEYNDITKVQAIGLWYAYSGYNKDIETMGEKGSLVSIGPEWASAAASPGSKFKFFSTDGGIRVPLIIAGPNLPSGTTDSAFSFVTDIVPTLLDYLHISSDSPEANDVAITGRSLLPVMEGRADYTYSADDIVAIEVAGNIALFKGEYKLTRNLAPHGDGAWHLYNIVNDPGETHDLAAIQPDTLRQLQDDYAAYAKEFGVQPVPDDFNIEQQVTKNSLSKVFEQYAWYMMIPAVLLLLLL